MHKVPLHHRLRLTGQCPVFTFSLIRPVSDKTDLSRKLLSQASQLEKLRTPPKPRPGTRRLFQTTQLRCTPEDVFEFFADARNLKKTTPPDLEFTLLSPENILLREETLLHYKIRLAGIRFSWTTRILSWEYPSMFVDEQARGPFSFWHHTHTFSPEGEHVRMDDEIIYRLPLWPFGEIAHPWVEKQLHRIFAYRQRQIIAALSKEN